VIDDLEAGRLERVLPGHLTRTTPIHAVFPSRRHQPARLRALDAAIAEAFAARSARCDAWLERAEG
jgi:DNA-binding transcriptional LysR family regulator